MQFSAEPSVTVFGLAFEAIFDGIKDGAEIRGIVYNTALSGPKFAALDGRTVNELKWYTGQSLADNSYVYWVGLVTVEPPLPAGQVFQVTIGTGSFSIESHGGQHLRTMLEEAEFNALPKSGAHRITIERTDDS